MLHLKRLDQITEADLLALIQEKVREGTLMDYKRAINLQADQSKAELCRDVSSFANAAGGHIVIGMDESGGLPTTLTGIPATTDFEKLEQQVNQICRSHLDPAVTTMRMRAIQLQAGTFAFLIRIDKTWNGPHMVMMDGENRCWTRDHSGKRPMDVPDLKQAIAFSEGAASRMKQFRMERLGNIVCGETPLPLISTQCIVVHFFPLVSFTGNPQVDLNLPDTDLRPMNSPEGWSPTFTLEGKMIYSSLRESQRAYTYALLFRNGVMEFTESLSLPPRKDGDLAGLKLFFAHHFLKVIEAVESALKTYRKIGISTPIFGTISLTNVREYNIFLEPQFAGIWGKPFNRDNLLLPEFVIEDLDVSIKDLLIESFNVWWQACGHNGCPQWFQKRFLEWT